MNEYDGADFKGLYDGGSLMKSVDITSVPWEIGVAQPIVCKILDGITPARLLDVGCGLGRNARAAFERGFDITAIDISDSAINICRELHSDSNIRFEVLDACNTHLTSDYEVILDSATYHAIPEGDRVNYLCEMNRLASSYTVFHLITFAPSSHGMPKPLASELSDITRNVELANWEIKLAERVEYKGNAEAIKDFQLKKGLNIKIDDAGMTRLPAWHLVLQTKAKS